MQPNTVHNIKSSLARLLATENIIVEHNPAAKTASFNVQTRVLQLPVWHNISEDLYDMLVVHETGHALDTPFDGWTNAIENIAKKHHEKVSNRIRMAVKDFLNVVEDARIDKRQKRRYPGSKINYVRGYKELMERNFFGVQNKDINTLPFLDRLNIYFKSSGIHIEFSKAEQALLNKVANAETFDEVIALSDELYGFCKQQKEEQDQQKQEYDEEQDDEMTESFEDFDEMESSDDYDDSSVEDIDDDSDVEETDDESDSETNKVTSDQDTQEENTDEDDAEQQESDEDHVPESLTEKAARENADTLVKNDNVEYHYCTVPKVNHDLVVDDFKIVIPDLEKCVSHHSSGWRNEQLGMFQEWKRKENETISFMVKEFETKKSADIYSRISIAKTGVIDTNKLHSYKYNEDIFRKLSITPTGKNHGFVMVVDWSGSMISNLEATMKQLFSLTMFCKRVQIPFEVFLFRALSHNENIDLNSKGGCFSKRSGDLKMEDFKLRNILSSRMNLATFNKAMECLWLGRYRGFQTDMLDSTPLNQAILALDKIVLDFQKKNKLQVVNTVILTDGCSDPLLGIHDPKPSNYGVPKVYTLRDEVTGLTFTQKNIPNYWYTDATSMFLRILKARTNCNLIGFYLYTGSLRSMPRETGLDYNYLLTEAAKSTWKENGYLSSTSIGYDEYFIINAFNMKEKNLQLHVNANMTKSKIAKEFMRFSGKKSVNRVLLSRFINRIAKQAA